MELVCRLRDQQSGWDVRVIDDSSLPSIAGKSSMLSISSNNSLCPCTLSFAYLVVRLLVSITGEWHMGQAHGRGRETNPDGTVRPDGQWSYDGPVRR